MVDEENYVPCTPESESENENESPVHQNELPDSVWNFLWNDFWEDPCAIKAGAVLRSFDGRMEQLQPLLLQPLARASLHLLEALSDTHFQAFLDYFNEQLPVPVLFGSPRTVIGVCALRRLLEFCYVLNLEERVSLVYSPNVIHAGIPGEDFFDLVRTLLLDVTERTAFFLSVPLDQIHLGLLFFRSLFTDLHEFLQVLLSLERSLENKLIAHAHLCGLRERLVGEGYALTESDVLFSPLLWNSSKSVQFLLFLKRCTFHLPNKKKQEVIDQGARTFLKNVYQYAMDHLKENEMKKRDFFRHYHGILKSMETILSSQVIAEWSQKLSCSPIH